MTLGELLVKLKRFHIVYREAPLVVEYTTPLGKVRRVELDGNGRLERDLMGNPIVVIRGNVSK